MQYHKVLDHLTLFNSQNKFLTNYQIVIIPEGTWKTQGQPKNFLNTLFAKDFVGKNMFFCKCNLQYTVLWWSKEMTYNLKYFTWDVVSNYFLVILTFSLAEPFPWQVK